MKNLQRFPRLVFTTLSSIIGLTSRVPSSAQPCELQPKEIYRQADEGSLGRQESLRRRSEIARSCSPAVVTSISRAYHVRATQLTTLLAGLAIAASVVGCGGGSADASLPSPQGAVADSTALKAPKSSRAMRLNEGVSFATPTELLDWAEWAYPTLFPGHATDLSQSPYIYRYYPQSGNYIGVADDSIYVMGPATAGVLKRVGSRSDYQCAVSPESCGTTLDGVSFSFDPGTRIDVVRTLHGDTGYGGVSGTINGDALSVLGSRPTIYLIVEDPQGVLAEPLLQFGSARFSLSMRAAPGAPAGLTNGFVRIQACLDPNCDVRIAGTPARIPYTVFVEGWPQASRTSIEAAGSAGQVSNQSISVPLPLGATGFHASVYQSGENYLINASDLTTTLSADGKSVTVNVALHHLLAGTYTATISLVAEFPPISSVNWPESRQEIGITYIVTGQDAAACTFPANYQIIASRSDPRVLDNRGISTDVPYSCWVYATRVWDDRSTIRLVSVPAGVDTSFQRLLFRYWDLLICDGERPNRCFPEGNYLYERVYVFKVEDLNNHSYREQLFTVPITLTVTP